MVVGRRSFPFGKVYFRGRTVSCRGVIQTVPVVSCHLITSVNQRGRKLSLFNGRSRDPLLTFSELGMKFKGFVTTNQRDIMYLPNIYCKDILSAMCMNPNQLKENHCMFKYINTYTYIYIYIYYIHHTKEITRIMQAQMSKTFKKNSSVVRYQEL